MLLLCLLIALLLTLLYLYLRPRPPAPAPALPGPPPRWLLGNLLDIPTRAPWLQFTRWAAHHDVFALRALGNSIVVLNTAQAIADLLEKRGSLYSDRPRLTMGGELMGLDQTTGMCAYGDTWRAHRKLARRALAPDVVPQYVPLQEHAARLYVRALAAAPRDFIAQTRLTAGRIVMGATYGLAVHSADDEYITETETVLARVNRALIPGAYLVDLIPALKHTPAWFPPAAFRREAAAARAEVERVVARPFEHVKRDIATNSAPPSFTADLLRDPSSTAESEHTIKWAAGSMYGAGGETTFAAVLTAILALALHPAAQRAAQAELDALLWDDDDDDGDEDGTKTQEAAKPHDTTPPAQRDQAPAPPPKPRTPRLPRAADAPRLPYVAALVKEVLRWHVVLPLGIARRAVEGDVYDGHTIPAGAVIFPNVWALAMDPARHTAPREFRPERFLPRAQKEKEGAGVGAGAGLPPDPYAYSFGFGRRICPGRHLAHTSLFLLISSLLAAFHIDAPPGLEPHFTPGLVSYPEPFECGIRVREGWGGVVRGG